MKIFIGLALAVLVAIGVGQWYGSQRFAGYAGRMESYLSDREAQRKRDDSTLNDRLNVLASDIKTLERSSAEFTKFVTAKVSEKDTNDAAAEFDKRKTAAKTEPMNEENKRDLDEISKMDPREVAKDPAAANQKAKELRERYEEITRHITEKTREKEAVDAEIAKLEEVKPRTPEIEQRLKELHDKSEQLRKEIKEKRDEQRELKIVMSVLAALLRAAALFALAFGQPELAFGLWAAAGALEGVGGGGGDGSGEKEAQGGQGPAAAAGEGPGRFTELPEQSPPPPSVSGSEVRGGGGEIAGRIRGNVYQIQRPGKDWEDFFTLDAEALPVAKDGKIWTVSKNKLYIEHNYNGHKYWEISGNPATLRKIPALPTRD